MFATSSPAVQRPAVSKPEHYRELGVQLRSLLAGERDWVANAANCAALLFALLPELNWAGFYVLRESGGSGGVSELVLGPFQGNPACVRIPVAPEPKGVCGTAASRRTTLLVADVHDFPGHIACDSASNSELVLPLAKDGRLWGVLDLDSPRIGRFDAEDARGLEALAKVFLDMTDLPAAH